LENHFDWATTQRQFSIMIIYHAFLVIEGFQTNQIIALLISFNKTAKLKAENNIHGWIMR
jgi:hypothetical protein